MSAEQDTATYDMPDDYWDDNAQCHICGGGPCTLQSGELYFCEQHWPDDNVEIDE